MDNKTPNNSDARAMTRDIDQATDLAANVGIQNRNTQGFGGAVLGAAGGATSPNNDAAMSAANSNNDVTMSAANPNVSAAMTATNQNREAIFSAMNPNADTAMSATERLEEDLREIEHSEEFVGVESGLQVQERLARDKAALQTEMGVGNPLVVEAVARSQEDLARKVVSEVNNIINQKSFRPAGLMDVYRKNSLQAIKLVRGSGLGAGN